MSKIYMILFFSAVCCVFAGQSVIAADDFNIVFQDFQTKVNSKQYKQLNEAIGEVVSGLLAIKNKEHRYLQASKVVSYLNQCSDEKIIEVIYSKIPLLVNTKRIGSENCLSILLWLKKYGTFKYIRYGGSPDVEYLCYYNSQLYGYVKKLYELYRSKSPIDNTLINDLYRECKKSLTGKRVLQLPDNDDTFLIDLYFSIPKKDLQESILMCLFLAKRYDAACSYAMIMQNSKGGSKHLAKVIIENILSVKKGEVPEIYLYDADEVKK